MHFYSAVNVTHWGLEPKSTPGNLPACTGSEIHVSDSTDVISQTHRPWFSFRLFAACLVCVRCKFGISRVLSFCFHPGDPPPPPPPPPLAREILEQGSDWKHVLRKRQPERRASVLLGPRSSACAALETTKEEEILKKNNKTRQCSFVYS